jgi:glycosyltransferase involved in cell wall biosynthesis
LNTSPQKPIRLAVLHTHPIQYHGPVYKQIAKHEKIQFKAFFCCSKGIDEYVDPGFGTTVKWDIPLLEGYEHQFLKYPALDIMKELYKYRPDILWINNYNSLPSWTAYFAALALRIPVLLRGDSYLLDNAGKSWARKLFKNTILRGFLKGISGILYVGACNRDFFKTYGAEDDKLFFAPHCVNNEYFRKENELRLPERADIRSRFGISDNRPIILFCGKLVPKKQPLLLLEAYRKVRSSTSCALLFAGDGPLRGDIQKEVEKSAITDVHITGFLNQTEIPNVYIAADVMVLTSAWDEVWGLALNEGMNFELPIIATDMVGGAFDLVKNGENGYIVPTGNVDILASKILEVFQSKDKLDSFGRRSAEIIDSYSYTEMVNNLIKTCELLVNQKT